MRPSARLSLLAVGAVLTIGMALWTSCGKAGSEAPTDDAEIFEPKAAQPRLMTLKLWVDEKPLVAEVAQSDIQLQTGMMFRTHLPENEGMLFVFREPALRGFWMEHTIVPLSLAYIDPEGVVREIYDLQPQNTNTVFSESRRIQYVLEVNQGWFGRNGLKPGAMVRTEQGSLAKTFGRR